MSQDTSRPEDLEYLRRMYEASMMAAPRGVLPEAPPDDPLIGRAIPNYTFSDPTIKISKRKSIVDILDSLDKQCAPVVAEKPLPEPLTKEQVLEKIQEIARSHKITLSVSPKGALAVHGLNRTLPVTLYRDEWEVIFQYVDQMRGFMKAHAGELKIRLG